MHAVCFFSPKQRPHLYTESNVKPPAKPPNQTHTVLPSSCGTTPRFVVCSFRVQVVYTQSLHETGSAKCNPGPAQLIGTKSRSLSVACFCAGTFFQRAFETGQGLDPAAKVELSATCHLESVSATWLGKWGNSSKKNNMPSQAKSGNGSRVGHAHMLHLLGAEMGTSCLLAVFGKHEEKHGTSEVATERLSLSTRSTYVNVVLTFDIGCSNLMMFFSNHLELCFPTNLFLCQFATRQVLFQQLESRLT